MLARAVSSAASPRACQELSKGWRSALTVHIPVGRCYVRNEALNGKGRPYWRGPFQVSEAAGSRRLLQNIYGVCATVNQFAVDASEADESNLSVSGIQLVQSDDSEVADLPDYIFLEVPKRHRDV